MIEPPLYDKTLRAVRDVGFPVLMVFVFIAWEAGWLPSQTRNLVLTARAHDVATLELVRAVNQFHTATRAQTLLSTCLAYARTAEIQQQCVVQYQRGGL